MKRHVLVPFLALAAPSVAAAQNYPPTADPYAGGPVICGPHRDPAMYAGTPPVYGPGKWHYTGWPYGPRTATPWTYPGLAGGPTITYPWGSFGYPAHAASCRPIGQCLWGPPVPVYGPVPQMTEDNELTHRWRDWPIVGMPFGWFGPYRASPRPKPVSVSVWPTADKVIGSAAPVTTPRGCLKLAVRVPQPGAEVFVDGVKTAQTGTDRVFESPPLEDGKAFRYELTARWVERGVTREVKRVVTGTPGEVVRIDFTGPEVIATAGK